MFSLTAFSQALPTVVLSQITEENGLSDNHVQCVLKDKEGLVWVGTADGLNLLDGSAIKIFRHADGDSASLANNDILSLAEDKAGNVWIATAAGISCYEKRKKSFCNFGLPHSPYGASNIVKKLLIDEAANLWCCTDGGLFRYDTKAKTATPFFNTTSGESPVAVNKVVNALMDEDRIWLATYDGLWAFDLRSAQFKRANGKANDASYEGLVNTVYKDKGGRLWFGNWSSGLKQFDKNKGAVVSYTNLPGAVTHVLAINEMELPDGRSVICLNGSLECFDAVTHQFFRLPKPLQFSDYPVVNNFYRSSDGWMWMGSAKGLYSYNPQRQFFRHRAFPKAITSQSVIFFEWKNELLIGGQGTDFLTAYDDGGRKKSPFKNLLQKLSATDVDHSSESSLCIVNESGNRLLIGSSGGILRYNLQSGGRTWFMHKEGDSTTLPKNFIQHIFIDSGKNYWVFPWREGIYLLNPDNGTVRLRCKGFLSQGAKTKGLVIADAAEDDEGNIWMADLDEGIVLFDRLANGFSKPFEAQIGTGSHSARVIYRDGWCYSFANEKLLKWNTRTRALQVFALPAQAGGAVYDLLLDRQGGWWIATKKGLFAFTESTRSFKQFTTADGLLNNDMDGNFYLRNDGDVLFGTPIYFTQFNPQVLLQASVAAASALLTSIEVNGENFACDGTKTPVFNYTQNNLFFRWAVPDFTNPFHNQYYCKLQGIDDGWKYVGNKGEMQYANLSPGRYTLLLKGATANGLAADKIISVRFKITPPFWKAVWFWAVCIGLAGLAAYWLVSRRIKEIKTKAAVNQQISELEVKALKAQMNPHFIFNSLSSIQESILSGNTEAASKYLGKFSKLIRAVLENSDKKLITLPDELDYLKLYLELESFRFDDFVFSLCATDIDDAGFVRLPPMLVQPYVENAIKHGLSHKEGSKKLSVFFNQVEQNLLRVTIEDNGVGRKQAAIINEARIAPHQSMGMKITEERLGLQKEGAVRPVEVEDTTNAEGKATGTRVTVYIAIEN